MLKIKNLTKRYGEKIAVNNISLEVESGQITAFIGHNGAGKTTTLKAIAGILDFDEGEIFVDGKNVKTQPLEAKNVIGYLPDNPDLYDNLKAIDYLNFIADVFKVDKSTREQRIKTYGERLKIYGDLGAPIGTYSHGMKQKLAILGLLVHKPKLYLFDEPFVGLDPLTSHELKLVMQEECKNGSAFFYSTHVLEVAEKLCTNVVIIKDGKIVGQGEMEKVTKDESLENVFLELEKTDEKHN